MLDIRNAELLFSEAQKLGMKPQWLTDYGLFSIQVRERSEYVFYGVSFLNSHLSATLAKNKHITRVILEKHGLPSIPYCLPRNMDEGYNFLYEHGEIIAKPTTGQRSEDVRLIKNKSELTVVPLESSILEKYIKGKEYRYLVLNGKVIAVHLKKYNSPISNPKLHHRFSIEQNDWDLVLVGMSVKIADIFRLKLAAVDFIITPAREKYILEVNGSPAIWRFHVPNHGPAINLARMLLEATVDLIKSHE